MKTMVRFGVSIPPPLLEKFDELIDEKGYANRSEAIRDIIRDRIIEREWERGGMVVGTITVLYDHHIRGVMEHLTELQHGYGEVCSTMHVHLDDRTCLEVIVVRGDAQKITNLADQMIATKGVIHGKLVMTSPLDL
jgi:CopG family nickel-responsive transcriptional regulator